MTTGRSESSLDFYISPLSQRNASRQMQEIWSPRRRYTTWRRVWLAAAEAQAEAGLPITAEQLDALRTHVEVTEDDLRRALQYEHKLRHDVMAHAHAYGDAAPGARGIIHLGMTSQDVVCNADLLILRDALDLVIVKLARVIDAAAQLARRYASLPTLAFTHLQPAQPTTVGRRAAQWGYDLALCLTRLESTLHHLRLRGLRGATGTQASFLHLFEGREDRVESMEAAFLRRLHWPGNLIHDLTAQTYPRVVDAFIVSDLAATAAVIHKVCTDIRLLCGRREVDEPSVEHQVGSSAMPFKQNPMRCERTCGLCRFVMSLAQDPLDTAATQWLERSLDDSSNRRVVLPEAFLALDGALDLLHSVLAGLVVHEHVIRRHLDAELPFLALENVLMAAVRRGRDRQDVHEALRRHALAAARRMKEGLPPDLSERLRAEPLLVGLDLDALLGAGEFVGRAEAQTRRFLQDIAESVRAGYATRYQQLPPSEPHV